MKDEANRGQIGVTPRPTKLFDESYLDFIQSFRKKLFREMLPVVSSQGETRYSLWKEQNGKTEDNIADIMTVFEEMPVAQTWQRFMRTQQEMMWRRTRASFLRSAESQLAGLDSSEAEGPAKLVLDPNFKLPDWAREEIHLQPGGYTEDPIGGIVYHYGTRVFYEGKNDQDELYQELTEKMGKPFDGHVRRFLDIGCSIGQGSIALKQAWPEAEVIGIDVALPLLRYARKRANDFGQEITFKQGLAEQTGYPDNYFDSILSYIIFHEMPVENTARVVKEMYRVLRPGGVFSIFEFPNHHGKNLSPGRRFLIDFDSKHNGEPYSIGFVYSNFRGMLKKAGFTLEEGLKTSNPFLQSIVARKPES